MSSAPVVIVGAGLGGLTLGRCLLSKGLLPLIIEKASIPSSRRHDYGVDLHSTTYRPLLDILGLEEAAFKRHVLIFQHDVGEKHLVPGSSWDKNLDGVLRCHRGRLEALLREGLNIKWRHSVSNATLGLTGVRVDIESQPWIETDTLVAADGVDSAIRKALLPSVKPYVHPYVVFYGTRTVSAEHYEKRFASGMHGKGSTEYRQDGILLRIFINNITTSEVILGYTYSRKAHHDAASDTLFKPARETSDAKKIPQTFYSELNDLKNLNPNFAQTFDPTEVRGDRLLHWLMRSVLPGNSDVVSLADRGVLMIGDAVHAVPILGGNGANLAMRDGMELAEWIAAKGWHASGEFVNMRYQQRTADVDKGTQ